jgi:hypothetical protein
MRELLQIIIFPFFLLFSIIQALVAKPLHFNYSKNKGLEIGIVPLVIIIAIFELIKYLITLWIKN